MCIHMQLIKIKCDMKRDAGNAQNFDVSKLMEYRENVS